MGYHPRIESATIPTLITTRSRNSRLWFINNRALEEAVLGYLAKFTKRYGVKLYAFGLEGSHEHAPILCPLGNRANFMRDLNSCIAKAVPRYTPEYEGGRFWGRRYSAEFLPGDEDLENYFFYTVLQPVQDGLVERISDYPGYNCFHDAVYGIKRKYKIVRWKEFNDARRRNPHARLKDFTDTVTLEYERLPGYEDLTQQEYAKLMHQKLEERRLVIVETRRSKGLGFVGRTKLMQAPRGQKPRNTKTSDRYTHRARVLSSCPIRKKECKNWYFSIYSDYKVASHEYRNGNLLVEFPPGTYKPPLPPNMASP